ncbi:MAG TPA: LysR family transcriptional regulator [Rhizomicrobium sp.]
MDTRIDDLAIGGTNWDDFRVFATVARTGNFYRAAMELETTQATISRRIGALEKSLNLTLFDRPRGRGGVILTFDGRRVLQEVSTAELALSEAYRNRGDRNRPEGDCKLLGTDGIANFWMPPFLRAFSERHPAIQLKYFLAGDQAANQRPPYDLQMQYLKSTEADTVSWQLATLHFMFMASPDYLAQFGQPETIGDLKHHKIVKFANHLSDDQSWSDYWSDMPNLTAAILSNSSAFLVELALGGVGIALMPTYLFATHPQLVPVLPAYHLKTAVFLNFQRDVAKKPAVRTTIDFLKDVAFDRRAMPWFHETFESPSPEWPGLARTLISSARLSR